MPRMTPPISAGLILSFMSVYTFSWEKIGKLRLRVAAEEIPSGRERQVNRARHEVEGDGEPQEGCRPEARRVRVLPHVEEPEREIDRGRHGRRDEPAARRQVPAHQRPRERVNQ